MSVVPPLATDAGIVICIRKLASAQQIADLDRRFAAIEAREAALTLTVDHLKQ